MSEPTPTIKTVRDHSEECEHGYTNEHVTKDLPEGYNPDEYTGKWWTCPGGREYAVTKVTAEWEGNMAVIRVDPGGEYWINLETTR